ncbi:TIGR03619 family F420-dependent LLM class oxidoreductase [soil metagenome]
MKFCHGLIGAPPEHWTRLAQACESAGFDSVAVSDHVLLPQTLESKYPYTPDGTPLFDAEEDWPDAWVAIGAMSAVTTTLRFVTNVFVLPARNPFIAAKTIGTASYLSGGRVRLGIGAGWMREEFELLQQPFAKRGKRMEEMIEIMRALWAGGMVEYHGEFYDFAPVEMRPALPAPVPIYVGGHSDIAFRRASTIGDGWLGVHYSVDELFAYLKVLQQAREDAGTADRAFEVIASPMAAARSDLVEELEAAGVTTILTSSWISGGLKAPEIGRAEEMIASYGERFIRS